MSLQHLNKLVINLPSRTDRLDLLKKELAGWEYKIIEGVEDPNPTVGIAKAHLKCIQLAKDNNWERVLILEDDLVLRKGAEDYFSHAINAAPEGWDVLLGGLYDSKGLKKVNEYWSLTGEFCGLHFYLVNQKAYDKILEWPGAYHIDRWINYKSQRTNCYVTNKFVTTQRNGFSDNVKKNVDYTDRLKGYQLL